MSRDTPASLDELAAACGESLPLPVLNDNGTVFAEPWQAHAFAMAVQLHQRGLFTWPEWATALTVEIRAAQAAGDRDDGSTYYQHWLGALEKLVIAKQVGTPAQIHQLEHAWEAAAERTPHGQPIELRPGDLLLN
ncbi:nitrile hydratase accessory protein [Rhodoferax sediminis]|uniref:Nitrile hydratase accessory protein n=2 Tax=Rhodoferax sediminis TaxID=2509614 RepID=A0A515DGN3_9BURK|nr:nitrile hydratase accessory protein [Rhodoferax sediminis]